jgi:CheY-like chemotaxis protein
MRHVLVVDDDDDIRTLLERVLSRHGFSVTTARDGYQALTEVIRRRPAVIVCDVVMPPPDGIRLLEMLRSQGIVIPSILITGFPLDRPHPADTLLMKPLDVTRLVDAVERLAGNAPVAG